MKWTDEGIILSTRLFGESSRILTLLTLHNGRHAGLIKVPKTRSRLSIETGTFVNASWNARLSDHLGQWQLETIAAYPARLLSFPLLLMALSSACTLTNQCLPERHPYPSLYNLLKKLVEDLVHVSGWLATYIDYEIALLKNLGFGLDLSTCAVTGQKDDLAYISPTSGRCVSRQAGEQYKDRLLPLPLNWINDAIPPDFNACLRVTGYFLNRHLAGQQGLPLIRQRLVKMMEE